MPEFIIRAWANQTLYDCRDYKVEAMNPEAAAALVRDTMQRIDDGEGPWIDLRTGEPYADMALMPPDREHVVVPLDPEEVIDGETGFALVEAVDGAMLRDVDPDANPDDPLPMDPEAARMADIATLARWAEAFFEQSRDDDQVPDDEQEERDDGIAALDRVQAWLKDSAP